MQYSPHDFVRDSLERLQELSDVVIRNEERQKADCERLGTRINGECEKLSTRITGNTKRIDDLEELAKNAVERRRNVSEGRQSTVFSASIDFIKIVLVLLLGIYLGHIFGNANVQPNYGVPVQIPRTTTH